MKQAYRESTDIRGRKVIVLEDDLSMALIVCGALGFAPLLLVGSVPVPLVLANLMVFGSLSAWFRYSRRRMRVMIDPAARTLAFGSRLRVRVLAISEVVRAQLNSVYLASMPGHPGGPRRQAHRVDLVLASGEVLPLMSGFAPFNVEDCHKLVERINQALK